MPGELSAFLTRLTYVSRTVTAVLGLVLVVAACSTDTSENTSTTESEPDSTAPTTTVAAAVTSTIARSSTTTSNVEGASLIWRQLGVGMSDSFLASSGELVLMNSERVFVADGFGDEDDIYSVSALDIESGEVVWQRDDLTEGVDDVFLQALTDEQLIVNGQYNSVTAVDTETGETNWTFGLPERYGAVRSSLSDGRLIVAATAPSEGDLRPPVVYSLDLADGSLAWETQLAEGTQVQWHSPPTSLELVFVATTLSYSDSASGNMLHAIELDTGNIQWSKDLGGGEGYHFYPNLVASGVLVIQASFGDIHGLNLADGAELWTYNQANPLGVSTEGDVYARDGGGIVQIDATTGDATRLMDPTALDDLQPTKATVLDQSQLVFVGFDGLRSYDMDTLDLVWQWRPSAITATPALGESVAAIVTGEPALSVIQFDTP